MQWLKNEDVILFLEQKNYDIRVSGNARWIDQKCTPDVIWSVADFVLEYVDNVKSEFSIKMIWQSDYAKQTIAETYSKPGTDEKTAENEFDKVFSQPLAMFCYAGIIKDISLNRKHLYIVENREILEYIAKNDVYALRFLHFYIEKVLVDSGLYPVFQAFFDNQDKAHFYTMKQAFVSFYHEYTPVKKDYEPKRIFTKVLNPLAFKNNKKGTKRGHLSADIIKKSDMMYNRDNFIDVYHDKPKGITRQEWLRLHPEIDRRDGYFEQMMSCSTRVLRKFIIENRNGISELTQFSEHHFDVVAATQIHHIFTRNEFPEIVHYIENLIALTPNQHFSFAHPNNNTHIVDLQAQKTLLIAKTHSIKQNLTEEDVPIYEFANFLTVLSVGWDNDSVLEIAENDYTDIIHSINHHYESI